MEEGKLVSVLVAKSVAVLAMAFASTACTDDSDPESRDVDSAEPEVTVEFFNSLAQPGAAQALQALMNVHTDKYPEERIFNNALDLFAFLELPQRIADGDPPDLIQWMAPEDLPSVQPLLPLNSFMESRPDIAENIYPEFMDEVTVDGQVYALPWELFRSNTLVYNKRVLDEHDLDPPVTIDELLATSEALKLAGVNPVGSYAIELVLEDVLAAVMGPEAFCDYVRGGDPDEATTREAIDIFAELVEKYHDRESLITLEGRTVEDELANFLDGKTAMLISGDWTPATLTELGWTSGVDFGYSAAPGTADLFYHGQLVLAVPKEAAHPEAAFNWMATIGSLEGHNTFFANKDGNSARKDIDRSVLNEQRRAFAEDLARSARRCYRPRIAMDALEPPLLEITETTPIDKEAVYQVVLSLDVGD